MASFNPDIHLSSLLQPLIMAERGYSSFSSSIIRAHGLSPCWQRCYCFVQFCLLYQTGSIFSFEGLVGWPGTHKKLQGNPDECLPRDTFGNSWKVSKPSGSLLPLKVFKQGRLTSGCDQHTNKWQPDNSYSITETIQAQQRGHSQMLSLS